MVAVEGGPVSEKVAKWSSRHVRREPQCLRPRSGLSLPPQVSALPAQGQCPRASAGASGQARSRPATSRGQSTRLPGAAVSSMAQNGSISLAKAIYTFLKIYESVRVLQIHTKAFSSLFTQPWFGPWGSFPLTPSEESTALFFLLSKTHL